MRTDATRILPNDTAMRRWSRPSRRRLRRIEQRAGVEERGDCRAEREAAVAHDPHEHEVEREIHADAR